LGALAGVIVTDFWICRRRALDVRQLYKVHGVHSFTKGFNIRAFIAFVCGVAPDLPGLAAACGAAGIPNGAKYLYSLSWLVATVISGFVYWVSFKIVPFEISPSQEMYMDGIQGVEEEAEKVSGEVTKKQFDL
jgi:NCS1 family nucleobase:cation symporter-1